MCNFRKGEGVRIKNWSPDCQIAPGTLVQIDTEIRPNWYAVFDSNGTSGVIHVNNLAVDTTPSLFTGEIMGEVTGSLF